MARRDVQLIQSLVDYVNDVKPYHTKLREFASEIVFSDDCRVSVFDDHHAHVFMKNVWTRDDAGGQSMSIVSEGTNADRFFRIPATIWPHFSINDHIQHQSPRGDDPVATDDELVDSDGDGLPDYEDPWTGDRGLHHFLGSDWEPVKAVINDWDIRLTSASKSGNTYSYTYDLELKVDSGIEDLYGLGNYFRVFVDGQDVTYLASRDGVIGAFDTDEYEDDSYDTENRAFTISGLNGTFTPTIRDLATFPKLGDQTASWVAQFAIARYRPQLELFYTNTGRYKVPFHQGSRVYVDGVPAVFGSTYTVESSRSFVQFLSGKHPTPNQTISVNAMTVDRLFISETRPFDVDPQQNINPHWVPYTGAGYDDVAYEDLPYDIGLPDSLCDYFTFKVDDVYPGRVSPVMFMNSTTLETKASLTVTDVLPAAINGEIYLVYATGMWTFAVQQIAPYRGDITYGSFKQPFTNGKVSFVVDRVWTPYYMVPETNTYSAYSQVYNLYKFETVDPTDHLVNLDLVTEHGVTSDPDSQGHIHAPVEFTSFGKVMKTVDTASMTKGWVGVETYDLSSGEVGIIINDVYRGGPAGLAGMEVGDVILAIGDEVVQNTVDFIRKIDETAPGSKITVTALRDLQTYVFDVTVSSQLEDLEYYQFVLSDIPDRGVYYEIMIEQTGGLNPRVHASIDDDVVITVLEDGNSFIYTEVYSSRNPNNPDITIVDEDPIDLGDPSQYVDSDYWDRDYVE